MERHECVEGSARETYIVDAREDLHQVFELEQSRTLGKRSGP